MESRVFRVKQFLSLVGLSFFVVSVASIEMLPDCQTPEYQLGHCLPYQQCKKYIDHLQSSMSSENLSDFIRKSRCNKNENFHICCSDDFLTVKTFIGSSKIANNLNPQGVEILNSIDDCGQISSKYVAYGTEVKLRELKFMALLEYNVPNENRYLCGATLITNRFVLSAAHCMVDKPAIVGVVLGEHNINTDLDCVRIGRYSRCNPRVERVGVEKIIPHPNYRKHFIDYDIGLVKMDKDVEFKIHINAICLPITTFTQVPQNSFNLAGWGVTETGRTSEVLKKVVVAYKEQSVCQQFYTRKQFTSHHLCGGGDNEFDSCSGDSGGPLFTTTKYLPNRGRYVQYGIVSLSGRVDCSSLNKPPSVFTNVTYFLPWITNNIIL